MKRTLPEGSVQRVGTFELDDGWKSAKDMFSRNPRNVPRANRVGNEAAFDPDSTPRRYNAFRNNCHIHARAVLRSFGRPTAP